MICTKCQNRYDTCSYCRGSGVEPHPEKFKGMKYVLCPDCENLYDTCDRCRGSGKILAKVVYA